MGFLNVNFDDSRVFVNDFAISLAPGSANKAHNNAANKEQNEADDRAHDTTPS